MAKQFLLVLIASAMSALAFAEERDSLQEVVVTGTRSATDVRHLPMTVTVVDREMLTSQHHTSVLPTLMQQVPGLIITSRSMMGYGVSTGAAGGISIRGISGGAGQVMVLIDGHPQYQGIYGHPIADSYQTLMAERVEVLRGPASMLYGSNAMGGVINIVTRQAKQDGVNTQIDLGAGSYGTLQAEASNHVRIGKFSSTVAAQYGRSDNHRPRMGFEQYGGYAKLGYDLNDHWNLFASADITHFNASNPGTTFEPRYDNDQWITRGVVTAGVENHYEKTSGSLSAYSNFGRHKIDDGTTNPSKPTDRYFRSRDALTGISWWQSAQFFEGNRVTLGVDYQHIYGHAYYTDKATGTEITTGDVAKMKYSGCSYRNELAAYIDIRQDLLRWLTVDAGVRFDHHSVTGNEWMPQAGIVVRPIATGELKALVSKGFRNPTMKELYLYPSSTTDLKPERLWNYELSWHHRLQGGFTYGANIFYLKGDNMIQTINRKNVNTGQVENFGFELEARYPIDNHFSINANTSFLHMKNKVVGAPTATGYVGLDYRQRRWFATLGVQHIEDLYTAVGEDEQTEDLWLLNASATYTLTRSFSLWVRGENLLAQSYQLNLGYPMPHATFMGGLTLRF